MTERRPAAGARRQHEWIEAMAKDITIGLVVPFTLTVIFPTNAQLSDAGLDVGSTKATALLNKWNRLHAVRSAAALVAFVVLLLHLGALL